MSGTNELFTFKTNTTEIYVQSWMTSSGKVYQALYGSGEAITEISNDKEHVVSEALRTISNTLDLLITRNDEV